MNGVAPAAKLLEQATRLAWLYGLGIVLAITITIAFIGLVAWTMWTNNNREMRLAGIIDNSLKLNSDILQRHDQRSADAIAVILEANRFQREEHKQLADENREQIELLRAINQRSSEARESGGHYHV